MGRLSARGACPIFFASRAFSPTGMSYQQPTTQIIRLQCRNLPGRYCLYNDNGRAKHSDVFCFRIEVRARRRIDLP